MRTTTPIALACVLVFGGFTLGQEVDDAPRPIPLTRPEMKRLLEDVKVRKPRIPLPELTQQDRELLGERADSYESRLRYHYLGSSEGGSRRFAREADPVASLDYGFKVELFWIVSRVNNCQYCLGHQESKLLGAGRSEDRIAALDFDWSQFTPAEQAAFSFARKYTFQPYALSDQDIEDLRPHFNDLQIIEMLLSMAWNNSINRWKEGVGVPQNPDEGGYSRRFRSTTAANESVVDQSLPSGSYLTPTSAAYENSITKVAPFLTSKVSSQRLANTAYVRPALESREEVEQRLQDCSRRQARLPLLDEASVRELVPLGENEPVPQWMRLVLHFPIDGVRRVNELQSAEQSSELGDLLRARISWVTARNDGAWYALSQACRRLRELGESDDQIFALDGDWHHLSDQDRALLLVAKHLAASPVILTDAEVTKAVQASSPAAVVQTIQYVTQRAAFNRITEAAGLSCEAR